KQCSLCSTATSIVSARSRPVNSSQQTNIIDLFDPNLEFSQEQVFEEYIDDFLSEQDSPLSQNNDDDSGIEMSINILLKPLLYSTKNFL
ncbi:unnamed protein product, partial [Rotaria socialis]